MADSKIYIKISSDNSTTSGNENQTAQTANGEPKTQKAGQKDSKADIVTAMLIDNAKKVVNTAISQYGNLTGDTITASRIQGMITIGSYALAIATTGWVGAVGVAVDVGLKAFTSFVETNKANAQIDLLRQRVGYSQLNNSRGGGYND